MPSNSFSNLVITGELFRLDLFLGSNHITVAFIAEDEDLLKKIASRLNSAPTNPIRGKVTRAGNVHKGETEVFYAIEPSQYPTPVDKLIPFVGGTNTRSLQTLNRFNPKKINRPTYPKL